MKENATYYFKIYKILRGKDIKLYRFIHFNELQ